MSTPARQVAEEILATMREQYSAPYTMVLADEAEFGHLDLSAYSSFSADLQRADFKSLGDLEVLEISNSPTTLLARTMIRNMLSKDGSVLAQYYQVKPRIGRRLKFLARGILNMRLIDAPKDFIRGMVTRHCVGFETEFQDGRQLITSNAQAAEMVSDPPSIESLYFPYGTSVQTLIDYHAARMVEISEESSPVRLETLDDVLNMQERQSILKVAHRQAIQWISQSELEAMSSGNNGLAEEVFEEIQSLVARERDPAQRRYKP